MEGHAELCVRADWIRAPVQVGPTVAGQQQYPIPANVDHFLNVSVASVPYSRADAQTVQWVDDGVLGYDPPTGSGAYFAVGDATGAKALALFPTPNAPGLTITLAAVLTPPALEEGVQDPITPTRFDRFLTAYAAWQIYEARQDDPDLGSYYAQQFEDGVSQLRLLSYSYGGREPFVAKVVGRTA